MITLAARANKTCHAQRKAFNLCRGNVVGKFVDPLQCKTQALTLANCFQEVSQVSSACQSAYSQSVSCLSQGSSDCSQVLTNF